MATDLPPTPARINPTASLQAGIDPGTDTDLGDPFPALLLERFTQIEDTREVVDQVRGLLNGGLPATALADNAQASLRRADTAATTDELAAVAAVVAALPRSPDGGAVPATDARIVKPSGDPTGATDTAAINAALAQTTAAGLTRQVILTGNYWTSAAILMPSNTELVLADAEVRRIGDGRSSASTNANIIRNSAQNAAGNTNIRVRGVGRAVLNGMPTTHTRDKSQESDRINGWSINNFFGLFWVNVTGLTVEGITLGPTNAFASCIQACENVVMQNVHIPQDLSTPNQDGLDIGPGCRNVVYRGITGRTEDDLFSIYAQNTSGSLHPYVRTLTNAQRDIDGINITDVRVNVGINTFRLQAGDGSQLRNITATGITQTNVTTTGAQSGEALVQLGWTGYVNEPPATSAGITNVSISKVTGQFNRLLSGDSKGSNITIRDVVLQGAKPWEQLVGLRRPQDSFDPVLRNVTLENITSTFDGGCGKLVKLSRGTVVGLRLSALNINQTSGLLNNGAAVTDVDVDGVRIASLTGNLVESTPAETGTVRNVTVLSKASGVRSLLGAASALAFVGQFPLLGGSDVTPVPVLGSTLIANQDKNLAGGATGQGAVYVADGAGWVRSLALPGIGQAPAADTTAPSKPGTPTATAGPGSASATTSGSTDNVAVSGYRWYMDNVLVSGSAATVSVTGLPGGTARTFTVEAYDAAGNTSARSAASNSVTPAAPPAPDTAPPSVPTNVVATGGPGKVDLTWTASTDNVAVTGYEVRRDGVLVATVTTTAYTDSGRAAGSYSYTVRALDAAGNSSASSTSATGTASAPPASTNQVDDFNRADSPTTGNGWTAVGPATYPITFNKMGVAGSPAAPATMFNVSPFTVDRVEQFAEIELFQPGLDAGKAIFPGVMCRYVSDQEYYAGYYDDTNKAFRVLRVQGGTTTVLLDVAQAAAPSTPSSYRISANKTTGLVRLLWGSTVVASGTDPNPLTGTKVGVRFRLGSNSSGTRADQERMQVDTFTAGGA